MKTKPLSRIEKPDEEVKRVATIPLQRAKEIMAEEGIEYSDDELKEILSFLSNIISITTAHYERLKQNEAKVISINTNTTHETTSIPLHPGEYRRAS